MNGTEDVQDLMMAISKLNELPSPTPLLKLYTIDTGQRKTCTAATSTCARYLSCGFQESSIAIWDFKGSREPTQLNRIHSLDHACVIGLYHPPKIVNEPTLKISSSVTICRGHSGPVYAQQFTPQNTHLISASDDTTVRLWDMSSMENTVVYRGHTYPIWSLDVSKHYFATGSQDRTAKLWTYDRTYPLRIFAGHTADVDVSNMTLA